MYYISGSSQLHLALLHSCELVVYLLSTEQNDEGLSYMLNLVYKHSLPRTACNMTWGPFGATNGTLTIIESSPSPSKKFHVLNVLMYCVQIYTRILCMCILTRVLSSGGGSFPPPKGKRERRKEGKERERDREVVGKGSVYIF